MEIQKICEYFNDIGLVQLNNINTFLKIYSQIPADKYNNQNDKLAYALFSYLTSASKDNQNLYDICKNIIESFSNNQIINRYRVLNILNHIFKSNLILRFNLFLYRLSNYIFKKQIIK